MERNLQPTSGGGQNSSHSGYPFSDSPRSSSSSFDLMFSGVSLHSLLTLNPSLPLGTPAINFLADDYIQATHNPNQFTDPFNPNKSFLPLPKLEPLNVQSEAEEVATSSEPTHYEHNPLDFFSKPETDFYDPSIFRPLPDLHSLESLPYPPESSIFKRPKYESNQRSNYPVHETPMSHQKFPISNLNLNLNYAIAIKPNSNLPNPEPKPESPVPEKIPPSIPQSILARQRRQKLSDKTRCLQKLIPWDKKMDMATTLEEAYKYVKFLQAQYSALQSMPSSSSGGSRTLGFSEDIAVAVGKWEFGGLEKLNRNQLLRVLVNSPVAQTMLYSQGRCVFSVEQLALLKKIPQRKLLLTHNLLFDN